ncbi:nuclease-related domain-containing protein [Streptomyces sp. NPDC048350]|uniref:nuclease-related domain-containing protein n=1 Tax=Streptomyces sp. NPDC048350 TaxID=3365538 RepID=UPI003720B9FB
MSELKVSVWKRPGHDRLYVNLPDGTAVAWADRRTGKVEFMVEEYRRAALEVLRPHLTKQETPTPPPPTLDKPTQVPAVCATRNEPTPRLPALTTTDDLALNRPGAALLSLIAAKGPTRLERAWARLCRRSSEWDPWFAGLAGERRVGRELKRLSSYGWRTLHGIPLPSGADIDHLLVGPGGVFSINTKHHEGKSVWVGDTMARVNRGRPVPYAAASKREADRVQRALERYCGFAVPVKPALVFVGVTELVKAATQLDVHVYRDREVSALGPLNGVLDARQVEQIYEVARHRRTWTRP